MAKNSKPTETPEVKTLTKEEAEKLAAKKAKRSAAKAEVKAAKAALNTFKETKEYKSLPKAIKDAIARLTIVSRREGTSRSSVMEFIQKMFPKVGTKVHELDVFKETKWGRGEFRKRIKHMLVKCEPAERMWISFDNDSESWVLRAVGEDSPKDFKL